MTTPEICTVAEDDLAARLMAVAASFVGELAEQGRLVDAGGAAALETFRSETEARRRLPSTYRAAIASIERCGYPAGMAARIASALHRDRLLVDDEDGPAPQHDRAPAPAPLAPASAGARIVHRVHTDQAGEHELAPERVEDQAPQMRPAAAIDTAAESVPEQTSEFRVEWSREYARAVTVAAELQARHANRTELSGLTADGQRVAVVIKAASLDDWEYWLTAIGAPFDVATHVAGYAQLAVGSVDGVAVHLTAHEVPRLLREAAASARESFHLWGRVYDLASGHRDRYDNVWIHLGQRQESSMPLMLLRGTAGPLYTLGSIIARNGPLTAIELPAAAPTVSAAGGEG
ncbi:BN159_2729 family protein [Streptomyces fagopyri]|uniref:BN159_2729 family protein n=1 Tax=Streptomyces fagopyri TaxID=2662397 RepID=UPI003814DF25